MENTYSDFLSNSLAAVESDTAKNILKDLSQTDMDGINPLNVIFKNLNEDAIIVFAKRFLILTTVYIFINILCRSFLKKNLCSTVQYCSSVIFSLTIVSPVYKLIVQASEYMKDISIFFGVLSPTIGILSASGGNVAAAKTQSVFFAVFLSIVQILINSLIPYVVALFIGLSIIDAVWGESRLTSLSAFIKNCLFGLFSIVAAIFFMIMNTSMKSSAGTDAISGKTLKLLISRSIPIVGGNISESLNLLGGGIVTMKNSVGVLSTVFILSLFVPIVILLWGSGIVLNLFAFLCDYFCIGEMKRTIVHLKCAVDFTLASFSVIIVIAFINIGSFMNIIPTVIA